MVGYSKVLFPLIGRRSRVKEIYNKTSKIKYFTLLLPKIQSYFAVTRTHSQVNASAATHTLQENVKTKDLYCQALKLWLCKTIECLCLYPYNFKNCTGMHHIHITGTILQLNDHFIRLHLSSPLLTFENLLGLTGESLAH